MFKNIQQLVKSQYGDMEAAAPDVHDIKQPYECKICFKKFAAASAYWNHVTYVHNNDKPFQCDVCLKKFSQSGLLRMHMRSHEDEKPFKWDVTYNLDMPPIPTKQPPAKPFECDICHNTFRRAHTLRIHMRVHFGEKLYKCEVCAKKFTQTTDLRKHMRTHTGDKLFLCKLCKKRFSNQRTLQRHRLTHVARKSYARTKAEKMKDQRKSKGQRKQEAGEKKMSVECDLCHMKFAKVGYLQDHLRKAHAKP